MSPPRKATPDPETNISPDLLDDGSDLAETAPDSRPPEASGEEIPVGEGFTPAEDGGNSQHPTHDEDAEDLEPDDYEREIDNANSAG